MPTPRINKENKNNPVKKGYVAKQEDWLYSSARNYLMNDSSVTEIDKIIL